MAPGTEKKLLQFIVMIACLVPLAAGFAGVTRGIAFLGAGSADLDSHFRYLSGLLLAIGFGFLSAIPRIEHHRARFRLLTFIVVTGGIARCFGLLLAGVPGWGMLFAVVMEIAVTPMLCLWQSRVARRLGLDFLR